MTDTVEAEIKRVEELLRLEYQMCHAGYVSRDQMAQDEFTKIVRVFSLLLTILLALSVFVKVNANLHLFFTLILGISGALAMGALLVDLQSTSTAKVALRKRSLEIEKRLGQPDVLVLWQRIDNRKKFRLEQALKGVTGHERDQEEHEGDLFAFASIALLIMWVLVVAAIVIYGQSIFFAARP